MALLSKSGLKSEIAPGKTARPVWTRVHLIYFALAAFDLLAVLSGLWLSEHTRGEFQRSTLSIDGSDFLHDRATILHRLAIELSSPGYELFYHRNAAKAQAKLDAASAAFDEEASEEGFAADLQTKVGATVAMPDHEAEDAVAALATLIGVPVELMEGHERLEDLARAQKADLVRMEAEAIANFSSGNQLAASISLGRSLQAGQRLQNLIIEMGSVATANSGIVVAKAKTSFAHAARLQYGIGAAILLMVLMVSTYATFVGRLLRRKYNELETAHAAVTESSNQLKAMNEGVTNLNVELAENVKRLNEAQTEIIRRGRLSQLGQLTATIAHEIRNPLGAVRTSAFLLARKTRDKALGIEPQILRINNGIQRCDDIITQLLDFTRTSPLKLEAAQIDSWLSRVLEEEVQQLPSAVDVEFTPGTDGQMAAFDDSRLRRAITNVLNNASEAMVGNGGDSQKFATAHPKITITTGRTARGVEISVRDNGPGMSEDTQKRILEPLFTTKNFGTGLGLPAVEKIMEQHGGGLEFSSKSSAGSCFTLWLPEARSKMEAA